MSEPVPQAVLKPSRVSWTWALPALAVIAAAWLAYSSWAGRGVIVRVQLEQGHGLEVGDEVRYRGIAVGEVRAIELDDDGVLVTAALDSDAERLARAGSRFWVVRPQLGVSHIAGLETLVGPRYLAVLPGRGAPQRRFVGLSEPPLVEDREPGDLEIIVTSAQKRNLRRGAPVMFRQLRIGTILSVGLTSDGGAVEARVHIDRPYRKIIRQGTRFWDAGGIEASLGLAGMTVKLENLETVLAGGVALATPPDAGEIVHTGYRFRLEPNPPDGWLEWQPLVVVGSDLLPEDAPLPAPLRAKMVWKQGRLLARQRSREGWVLQTDQGLLGPADLLRPGEEAEQGSIMLEVAGTVLPLDAAPRWAEGGLAVVEARMTSELWPARRSRRAAEPEDCLAVGDPTAAPLPLAANRLDEAGDGWKVDAAVPIDESWHGAAVVARADGLLVGLVLVADDEARVALLPENSGQPPFPTR